MAFSGEKNENLRQKLTCHSAFWHSPLFLVFGPICFNKDVPQTGINKVRHCCDMVCFSYNSLMVWGVPQCCDK